MLKIRFQFMHISLLPLKNRFYGFEQAMVVVVAVCRLINILEVHF